MSEVSITIKTHGGYDATWLNFSGKPDDVKLDLIETFGLDYETHGGMTLSSVVTNAENVAHGKGNVAGTLGGKVVSETPYADQGHPADKGEPEAPAEPEESPEDRIKAAIEEASTEADMKRIYAENTAVIKDDKELAAAWKAKWKTVKGK